MTSIIPILITFITIYGNYSDFYKDQIKTTAISVNTNQAKTTNNKFDNIEKISDSIIFQQITTDVDVLSIFKQEYNKNQLSSYEKLQNNRKLEYIVNGFLYSHDEIDGIYFLTKSGNIYSYSKYKELSFGEDFDKSDWYKKTLDNKGKMYVSELRDQDANASNPIKIAFSRCVIDVNTNMDIGVILIACNNKLFDELQNSSLPESNISIIDKNGDFICKYGLNSEEKFGEGILSNLEKNEQGFLYDKSKNEYIAYNTLKFGDWKIVIRLSISTFVDEFSSNLKYVFLIIVLCIIMSLIISIILSHKFSKPIIKLSEIIKSTEIEDIKINKKMLQRKDEVGVLYRGFADMIESINKLIKEKYINQITLLDSKLKALMSQINSHFIFNSLEIINSLAQIERVEKISIISKSLGDMLRYTINNEQDTVEIRKEIEQVKSYISIQEIRFGKSINVNYNVENDLYNERVLKLIFQPLVENSISHGFLNKKDIWKIDINVYRYEKLIKIQVSDNGVGIKYDRLCDIRKSLKSGIKICDKEGNKGNLGIGLININSRLKFFYGDEYGIDIESNEGQGTDIIIFIPTILEERTEE